MWKFECKMAAHKYDNTTTSSFSGKRTVTSLYNIHDHPELLPGEFFFLISLIKSWNASNELVLCTQYWAAVAIELTNPSHLAKARAIHVWWESRYVGLGPGWPLFAWLLSHKGRFSELWAGSDVNFLKGTTCPHQALLVLFCRSEIASKSSLVAQGEAINGTMIMRHTFMEPACFYQDFINRSFLMK